MSHLQPTIHYTDAEDRQHQHQHHYQQHHQQHQQQYHINPSLFNPNNNNNVMQGQQNPGHTMSRSSSGASASDAGNDASRLLTPHIEYRDPMGNGPNGTVNSDDLRKVSDPMTYNVQSGRHRLYPQSLAPNYGMHEHGSGLGLGPHPQQHAGGQGDIYLRGGYNGGEHYAMSSERQEHKAPLGMMGLDTEYERQREAQIMDNRKLLEEVGLSGQSTVSSIVFLQHTLHLSP
jgi:hypothetical protein